MAAKAQRTLVFGIKQLTQIAFAGPNSPKRMIEVQQIAGLDPKAANTFDRPDVILPRAIAPTALDGDNVLLKLRPLSLTMIELAL